MSYYIGVIGEGLFIRNNALLYESKKDYDVIDFSSHDIVNKWISTHILKPDDVLMFDESTEDVYNFFTLSDIKINAVSLNSFDLSKVHGASKHINKIEILFFGRTKYESATTKTFIESLPLNVERIKFIIETFGSDTKLSEVDVFEYFLGEYSSVCYPVSLKKIEFMICIACAFTKKSGSYKHLLGTLGEIDEVVFSGSLNQIFKKGEGIF